MVRTLEATGCSIPPTQQGWAVGIAYFLWVIGPRATASALHRALRSGGAGGTPKGHQRDTPPMEGLEYAQWLGEPRR